MKPEHEHEHVEDCPACKAATDQIMELRGKIREFIRNNQIEAGRETASAFLSIAVDAMGQEPDVDAVAWMFSLLGRMIGAHVMPFQIKTDPPAPSETRN